jgi:SP family myo-inositol transporter-like MFS transporter 13
MLAISIGLSNTVWGITSEIIPNYLLAQASALIATWGWVLNFAINSIFLNILDDPDGKWYLFLILAAVAFFAILFVWLCIPETVGKSVKENLEVIIGREALD